MGDAFSTSLPITFKNKAPIALVCFVECATLGRNGFCLLLLYHHFAALHKN